MTRVDTPEPDAALAAVEHALSRTILLISLARGHLATRGRTNLGPLTAALCDAVDALLKNDAAVAPRLMPRVRTLTDSLAALVCEAETARGDNALSAVA